MSSLKDTFEFAKIKMPPFDKGGRFWFLDKKYEKSIKDIMGQTLVSCHTNTKEFETKKVGDVMKFQKTKPMYYTRANWNAGMVCNFIHLLANDEQYSPYLKQEKEEQAYNAMLEKCKGIFMTEYTKEPDDKLKLKKSREEAIDKAYKDISRYLQISSGYALYSRSFLLGV